METRERILKVAKEMGKSAAEILMNLMDKETILSETVILNGNNMRESSIRGITI